jgi:hypothetical protein
VRTFPCDRGTLSVVSAPLCELKRGQTCTRKTWGPLFTGSSSALGLFFLMLLLMLWSFPFSPSLLIVIALDHHSCVAVECYHRSSPPSISVVYVFVWVSVCLQLYAHRSSSKKALLSQWGNTGFLNECWFCTCVFLLLVDMAFTPHFWLLLCKYVCACVCVACVLFRFCFYRRCVLSVFFFFSEC